MRLRFALAPTVGPPKLVDPSDFVENGTPNTETGVSLEGNPSRRIEAVDGVDQADDRGGLEVVGAGDRAGGHVHPVGDPCREGRVALDQSAAGRGITRPTECPKRGRFRQGPPPPRRASTGDLVQISPLRARRRANCARAGSNG